jgi:hypothetical protein
MGTTYFLGADLILEPARHDLWLTMPLEGVAAPTGGWIEDGPVELANAAAVLSALAEAADHFSYLVDGERITLRAFFSHDWLIDRGPELARALAAFARAEGTGSAVLGDAGTRWGAVTQLAPGKPPKTSAMRAGALDTATLAAASQSPPTDFAPTKASGPRSRSSAKPAGAPRAGAKGTAKKTAKPAAKTAKKPAAKTAKKTVSKTAKKPAAKTAKKTASKTAKKPARR